LNVTDVAVVEPEPHRLFDPAPVVPRQRSCVMAPGTAVQVNVSTGPASVLPDAVRAMLIGMVATPVLACAFSFNGREAFRLRVAVSSSSPEIWRTSRSLKVAEPQARFSTVAPPRNEGLPDMTMGLVAAVAATRLSVNSTSGAGERACPTIALAGGWLVKASA